MKRKRVYRYFLLAIAGLVLLPSVVLSEMVVTTWEFMIADAGDLYGTHATDVFDVGDSAFVSVYYDDAIGIMHDYDDGPDGISWTADDTVVYEYDLADGGSWAYYNMFADAQSLVVSSKLHQYLYEGSLRDTLNAPRNRISYYTPFNQLEYLYRDDAIDMRLLVNHSGSVISIKASTWDFMYPNEVVGTLTSVTTSPVLIPLPGAVLLGSMGLGVAGYRLRRRC